MYTKKYKMLFFYFERKNNKPTKPTNLKTQFITGVPIRIYKFISDLARLSEQLISMPRKKNVNEEKKITTFRETVYQT